MQPTDLRAFMRAYLSDRAPVVGYETAMREVDEGVANLRLYGSTPLDHISPDASALRPPIHGLIPMTDWRE